MQSNCTGTHRFFVADVAVVEAEGIVNVIVVCTACGESAMRVHRVTGKVKLEKGKTENVTLQG